MLGECSKETAFEMLDFFVDNGGNFIDTANSYQEEESEKWLGEWMALRKNRDDLVLATKYTQFYKPDAKIRYNYQGNHRKSMYHSLENSLKNLQTSYIDIFYVHWWDFSTSIEEVMQSLHHLVQAGKIFYLGANARDHGLTPFCVYQGKWSAADRDFEREILPMARHEGMALAPFGALGQGKFKKEAGGGQAPAAAEGDARKLFVEVDKYKQVFKVLDKLAAGKGTLPTSVALAYVMSKAPYVFPIVGGRKIEHLKANIDALDIVLSDAELDEIDAATPFEHGFPMELMFEFHGAQKYNSRMTSKDVVLLKCASYLEEPEPVKPVGKPRI
ncbi:putative glucose-methanol-choline oxidoreductase:gmc oxidoreductase protein [Lasiodiplodia theobromae]|uniref:Glucose-methanol-choline oxidoreductase n=1 Tax=Lasiodiplodia theobromae TaxID=45133 RepID=UPI0015C3946A|nr:Glucose-methanol-choline oxidoreductase [Lasiodiplodia theobromae]KAF4544683.1 Glucose-methanol-choline oxidoreductase [Lasiodiplodia theobromae]KAF9637944.1 putative glucose-methanol-choline oxidoreductase:gmc oxidoreductase protein [Lasiodiplodia theobromae]